MTATSITMTEEEDPSSSSSVHLHQIQIDDEFQNDNCITTDNNTIMNQINTNQYKKRLSLIRLESGRQIWWLENGISSHRAEVMLRRRMCYLQEEQELQQQQLQAVLRENDGDNISIESGVDFVAQSDCDQGGHHNRILSTAIYDGSTEEPITKALPSSNDIDNLLPMEVNTNFSSEQVANNSNTINAAREVSLESIDEPTLQPAHQHKSNQQLIQHCHEQNIPVIAVGTITSSHKKTWLDFGEDNVNAVGEISTRQLLIYASTESFGATSSAVLVADDSSVINITLDRMSSKGGFTCMLHGSSSFTKCARKHHEPSCDPLQFQMKHGEAQMIHVVWNPIQEGCVRENIELRIHNGEGQKVTHEIVLVGSAREGDSTTHAIEPSNVIIEKEEWNGVSVECSEIREDDSKHDLNVDEVGLTVTEESIECSSIATHEVDELIEMMKNASISPKKASMAAKSLSQLSEPRNEDDAAPNRSPNRRVNAKQIMAVQEEIKSGRVFAEESRLTSQTSQDFVNGLYMNDKVRGLLDDFDAESVSSTDGRGSGRSTPTFGSLSSEEEKSILSGDVSHRLCDDQEVESEIEAVEEDLTAEKTEIGADVVASLDENQSSEMLNTSTSDHYNKVTTELDALMEDVSDDLQSQSESDDGSYLSSEESDQSHISDISQRLEGDQQVESEVEAVEEDLAAGKAETGGAGALATQFEYHKSSERLNTTTSDHYDKVTADLNALMEDVTGDLQSQPESEDGSCLSSEESDQSESENDSGSYLSSGESDSSQDEKVGIFNFDESITSNEENEELNMLPGTSIHSSDWGSSGVDTSIDSDQLQNPYRQMSSEMDSLMDEFSELEQFAQMQQNYLTSPTTHNFQTQLENINEQIDNFTPSPANATWTKNVERNTSDNRPALRVKVTKELEKASEPPTVKVSAKRCYFYKSPRKEKGKTLEKASLFEKVSILSTPSSEVVKEKREPYKSPFAAVFEAETSSQFNDSMLDSFPSSDGSDCASTNSSDGIMADSSSLDESFASGESELGNTSADLKDDISTSNSSCETSSSISSQNKEMNGVERESPQETRSEQIASMKSKLSSWKAENNDQFQTPLVSRTQRHSSPAEIPQPSSSTRKVQFAKSLDVSPLKTPASTSQVPKERQYSSPSKVPRLTPYSRKLQLNTPTHKKLDVASLTASATSTAQKSARMTYGYFSQSSTAERSPADSEVAKTSRFSAKKTFLNTPPPRRATSQLMLKTPSSISAYEKHVERMRKSRARNSFT